MNEDCRFPLLLKLPTFRLWDNKHFALSSKIHPDHTLDFEWGKDTKLYRTNKTFLEKNDIKVNNIELRYDKVGVCRKEA